MSTVSIVIRCLNEGEHIGRLLAGISRQTVRDVDVVVVDSGSVDSTLEVAAAHSARIVQVRPEEFSFGRSLNIGCRAARGELIVIVSAHTYPVCEDWLERLVSHFDDPRVGLVYGKQRGDSRTKFSEGRIFVRWFGEASNPDQDHPFCNNANAAIRRSLWEALPYDETLTGLEDIDWARRAMLLGYKVAYDASAEIIHVHNESHRHIYSRYRREAIALKRVFPHEKFTLWDFLRLYCANVLSDLRHAGHDRTLLANLGSVLAFRFLQFWGTYNGFSHRGEVTSELKRKFYYPAGMAPGCDSAQSRPPSQGERCIDYTSLGARTNYVRNR